MAKDCSLRERNVGTIIPEDELIDLLDQLARLVEELTPRLDYVLSDAVTADQRRSFRERAGSARVFDLSNGMCWLNKRINALCSETAREHAMGNLKK